MRSPDPVNWTVPLDTGKTFTVTQNVKEGKSAFEILKKKLNFIFYNFQISQARTTADLRAR